MGRRGPFQPVFWMVLALAVVLAACGDRDRARQPSEPTPPSDKPLSGARYVPVPLTELPGWQADDFAGSVQAFSRSCTRFTAMDPAQPIGPGGIGGLVADWQGLCAALDDADLASPNASPDAVRAFFAAYFAAYRVETGDGPSGTFTGYYEASLTGSRTRGGPYQTPLYAIPDDLVEVNLGRFAADLAGRTIIGQKQGKDLVPYPTREQIDVQQVLGEDARVLAWVTDPVDAHVLHIQGSGRVALPDGSVMRVGYAASNGRKFTGIGGILLREGVLPPGQGSMPHVRAWLRSHPEQARTLMARNARYIFFRELQGDGPIGGFGVPLTPLRSLAVDPAFVPLGIPVWLATRDPDGQSLDRLMFAQDVGAAITGAVRGDVFWGYGEDAFAKAGRMKSPGKLYMLLPVVVTRTVTGVSGS